MKYLALYGSLRVDQYNYNWIKSIYPGEFNFIEQNTISGYEMFDLGPYPAIAESTEDKIITVDIIQCNDHAYHYIEAMERDAGYKEKTVQINGNSCILFYWDDLNYLKKNSNGLVESGDWVEYLDTRVTN